jgi:hypothetical protein
MDQSGESGRTTPWWYRVPRVAVGVIAQSLVSIVLFTTVSESGLVWAGGGLLAAFLATFVQGMGQAAYDERHPR